MSVGKPTEKTLSCADAGTTEGLSGLECVASFRLPLLAKRRHQEPQGCHAPTLAALFEAGETLAHCLRYSSLATAVSAAKFSGSAYGIVHVAMPKGTKAFPAELLPLD